MFPNSCPSYQKASIKLFKVEKNDKDKEKLVLVDSQYFDNKDGMGYMLKNLTKGDYQIQFKKYSFGFDTFDFSAMLYAGKHIKLVDIEESEIKKAKAKD
jgi:hypothetical protein